jgi:hypothetical protein
MGVYSKALHHVNNKDFKKTHQRRLDEEKFLSLKIREKEILEQQEVEQIKEISSSLKSDWKSELFPEVKQEVKKEEVKVKVKVPEKLKSDWKKELSEGMTTGGQEVQFAPSDIPLDTIDAADPASFTVNNGGFDSDPPSDGLSGAEIVSSGTGSGNNGGFNLGRSYLSFNGVGFNDSGSPEFDNIRHVILSPVDATRATTLEITAIVGNGLNGGEAPGVNQDLQLWFTDINDPETITAAFDDNGNFINVVPYNGYGSLRTYSVTIPNNQYNQLRRSGISFVLFQNQGDNPTTTGDNYGITEVKVKRTTPVSVVAPLDSPEAVSFFRVGTGPNVETPEQRYRRITQQLLASKNYTNQKFGSNYPGSNFSGIIGVSASPLGRNGMLSAWGGGIGPDMSQLQNQKAGQVNNKNSALQNKLAALEKENQRLSQSRNPADWDKAQFGTAPEIARLRAELSKSTPSTSSGETNRPAGATFTTQKSDAFMAGFNKEAQRLGMPIRDNWGRIVSSVPSTPPPSISQSKSSTKLTPQQLANMDRQIKQLEADNEKIKADQNKRAWELAANLAMDVVTAAALLTPIPGDEAAVIGARTAAQTAKMARNYQRQNPGKYNPFLSDKANQLARQQGVGTNVKGQNPAFRNPLKNSYEPQGEVISEKKTSKTLKSVQQALYPGQPSPNGFPDQDPPKQLPNGFHQDYGQKDNMYNTLDKASAMSMPPTGNPEIDKKVAKARKQPK